MNDSLAPGQQEENDLRSGGFSNDEISDWKGQTYQDLQKGGFGDDEIKGYFGVKDPDLSAIKTHVKQNVSNYQTAKSPADAAMDKFKEMYSQLPGSQPPQATASGRPETPKPAHDFVEALEAGLQMSSAGLYIRGKMPNTVLPEDADRAMRIANQIGSLAGDMPAMVAGGIFGTGAGTVALPVLPGVGSLLGASAGAFAVPAAMRKILIDHYTKGDIMTAGDFADRAVGASWEAIKGGLTGIATTISGGAATALAGPLVGIGAEIAAMTYVSKGLEGQLPNADDFIDGAIVIGGLHGAGMIGGKLRNTFANTGEAPHTIVDAAEQDVILKQQLLSEDTTSPPQAAEGHLVNKNVDDEMEQDRQRIVEDFDHIIEDPVYPLNPEDVSKMQQAIRDAGHPYATLDEVNQADTLQQLLHDHNDYLEEHGGTKVHVPSMDYTDVLDAEQAKMDEKPARMTQVLEPKPQEGLPEPKASEIERTEAEKEILSKLGENPEATSKSVKDKFDEFYAKNVDYLDPMLVAETAAGKDITPDDSSYNLGRRFAAHMDKVRSFVEFGTRGFNSGEINGEGLNQIYRDVPNGDLDGLRAYGMAQRALELERRGLKPWDAFNAETAEQVVADGKDKFEAINQRRIDFSNRVVDYAGESGLFSDKQIARMKELNQEHFPFYRVQDPDMFTGKVAGGAALKKIYGSDRAILDPILSTYKNVEMLIKKAEINVIRNKLLENTTVESEDGAGVKNDWLQKADKKMVPIAVGSKELAQALDKQGIGLDAEDITLFRPEKSFLKDNQVILYQNGKPVVYEGPPLLIDSMRRLDGDGTMMDIYGKVLAGFTKATRVGVTSDPGFGFRHFFRSQIMSSIYSQTGMIPFYDSAKVLGEFMKEGKAYQDWLYNGGAVSSWDRLDERYLENNLQEVEKSAPFLNQAWNVIKSVPEASEAFIKLTDNLSRFAEYKNALDQGKSPGEAAMMSREVTPDYQKVGLQRSVLRTGVAFIGAHINSLDRMAQAFKEDPKGTTARLGVLTAMSAALWAVNKDDKAINDLPDWQKDLYWNINISRMFGGNDDGHSMILRLPKPWSAGIIFASGIEVVLDSLFKDFPNRVQHFVESLMASVVPNVIPNLAQPILDQYSNKNAFSGRPLVSQDKEKLLPDLMYSPYTSETAKGIAKLIGHVPLVKDIGPSTDPLSSPAVVENYIHGWTGTLGGWALRLSDYTGSKLGIIPENTAHSADTIADSPFFKEFVSRYPTMKSQTVEDFYQSLDKTNRVMNSISYAAKHGEYEMSQEFIKKYPDFEIKLNGISSGISTIKKTIQNVQDNPNIPPVEKRQLMDTMLFQAGSMANMGNILMSDFKKSNDQQENKGH